MKNKPVFSHSRPMSHVAYHNRCKGEITGYFFFFFVFPITEEMSIFTTLEHIPKLKRKLLAEMLFPSSEFLPGCPLVSIIPWRVYIPNIRPYY